MIVKMGTSKKEVQRNWLIIDNGYQAWVVLVPPSKVSTSRKKISWSQWLESLRKGIECTFGILKGRWRVLKAVVQVHGTADADLIWKTTCCALHNMLLDVDGVVDKEWNSDWTGDLGECNTSDMPEAIRWLLNSENLCDYDSSRMGVGDDQDASGHSEVEGSQNNRQSSYQEWLVCTYCIFIFGWL